MQSDDTPENSAHLEEAPTPDPAGPWAVIRYVSGRPEIVARYQHREHARAAVRRESERLGKRCWWRVDRARELSRLQAEVPQAQPANNVVQSPSSGTQPRANSPVQGPRVVYQEAAFRIVDRHDRPLTVELRDEDALGVLFWRALPEGDVQRTRILEMALRAATSGRTLRAVAS